METQPLFPLMAVPNGKVLEDLGAFAYNAAWSTESQPYWKDEPRAEQGFAFENVVSVTWTRMLGFLANGHRFAASCGVGSSDPASEATGVHSLRCR